MLMFERRQRVLDSLRQRKAVQLEELARELGVSVSTIRRDIEAFEQEGIVERTHGGAVYRGDMGGNGAPAPSTNVSTLAGHNATLSERMAAQVAQKQAIGKLAASLVQPQMTLLLDGGSTIVYAAQQITARPLQVVTNSLAIANLFVDDDQVELLLIGGNLYPRTAVTIGPLATGCLADLHADLLFFSVAGILDGIAYNINMSMAEVELAMMRQASRCVLLMDSSKFGRKSLVRVCGVEEVDQVIADSDLSQPWRDALGNRLLVADKT